MAELLFGRWMNICICKQKPVKQPGERSGQAIIYSCMLEQSHSVQRLVQKETAVSTEMLCEYDAYSCVDMQKLRHNSVTIGAPW